MSSILRALKKLENDPRHLEANQSLETKFVPLAETGSPRKPSAIILMIIGGSVVCGLTIITGWWFISGKNQSAPVATQQISPQTAQPSVSPSAAPEEPSLPERSTDAGEPAPPAAVITAPRETTEPEPVSTPVKLQAAEATGQNETVTGTEPAPEPAGIESEWQEQKNAAAVPATGESAADAGIPGVTPEYEKPEIPVLADPEMKLQAITWSKDPDKRIAVINNKILRQGETVSGYRIDTINQDDVVLSDGDSKWQIIFRIR